mgnify:CR=1 FL=1
MPPCRRRHEFRECVLHIPDRKIAAFFVTLHKTEEAYSPTTMYENYAISGQLFHLQSQSTTSADSPPRTPSSVRPNMCLTRAVAR